MTTARIGGRIWRERAAAAAKASAATHPSSRAELVSRTAADTPEAPTLTRPLLVTMALACGLGVANLYYNQPLLGRIGHDLHAGVRQVGLLPMLTQIGFGIGVFFLAPLGDVLERRGLILKMLGLLALSLAGAALAPNLFWLSVASLVIGITTVISTLVLPFAVALSDPKQRGATVGTIAGAMLIGVLCSRTLSGIVGEFCGWRTVYAAATGLMVALALLLRRLLPRSQPTAQISYGRLLRSMLGFVRTEPQLRAATVNGMLLYAALSAFWATLAFFVESPAYRMGPAVAGLFGLVGAGSAMAAPLVGRLTDRRSPRVLVGIAAVIMLASFAVLWIAGAHLLGLIVGVIGLDIAAQAATVSNQATVYSLRPDAQSRMYTVYRAMYSVGGSIGAYLGAVAWSHWGWSGVCGVGSLLLIAALALHARASSRP